MTDINNNTGSTSGGLRGRASERLQGASSTATDVIATNPLAVLAGGLAVGVVAGALLPRSERERRALDPLGRRIAEGATAAFAAAKDTGKERLNASILSKDAATESARQIFQSAVSAAKEANAGQAQTANTPQAPTIA
jgi:hypothetical protein